MGRNVGQTHSMDVVKILPGLVTSSITDDNNAFQIILDANEVEKTVKTRTYMFMVNSSLFHMTMI